MPIPPKPAPMIVTEGGRDANEDLRNGVRERASRYVQPPSLRMHR